jgi:hypothetical protein
MIPNSIILRDLRICSDDLIVTVKVGLCMKVSGKWRAGRPGEFTLPQNVTDRWQVN